MPSITDTDFSYLDCPCVLFGLNKDLLFTQFLTPGLLSDRMFCPLTTETTETVQLCDSLSAYSSAIGDQSQQMLHLTAQVHQLVEELSQMTV